MKRWFSSLWCAACMLGLSLCALSAVAAEPEKPAEPKAGAKADEPIDVERAKKLFQKRQAGEKLTADEEAYLRKAIEQRGGGGGGGSIEERLKAAGLDPERAKKLRQKHLSGEKLSEEDLAFLKKAHEALGQKLPPAGDPNARPANPGNPAGPTRAIYGRDKTGFKPLTEMTADDRYLGQDGGLYGGGKNTPPAAHLAAALAASKAIAPLNRDGKPDPAGKIVLVSISMSNATQEFSMFKQIADADAAKSAKLQIIDCAQGGQAMAEWVSPTAGPWTDAERRITQAQASDQQVQIAWIKLANKGPRGDLDEHGRKLESDTRTVIQNAKAKFPNLKLIYLGSRIFGGYTMSPLNPEPYAYESAFVARWLIQDQIAGNKELNYDPAKGEVKAPVLLWGAYCWGDGLTPRAADKLTWTREDFVGDGTHPSNSGREKVARMLLDFFKTDETAKGWFAK